MAEGWRGLEVDWLICVILHHVDMAPEIIADGRTRRKYDGKAADVWSIGVVVYEVITGEVMFGSLCESVLVCTGMSNLSICDHWPFRFGSIAHSLVAISREAPV